MTSFSIQRHDHFIESSQKQSLLLRIKEVAPDKDDRQGVEAILCIHGAVLHSILFDLPVKEMSWLEAFARQGVYGFSLDLRGYGRSSKSKVLEDAESVKGSYACVHEEALQDIFDAVMFIKSRLRIEKITLVGLSWGSVLVGAFTERYPELVKNLVLLGPVYSYPNPIWKFILNDENPAELHPSTGPFRILDQHSFFSGWDGEILSPDKKMWRSEEVERSILFEMLQSDASWSQSQGVQGVRVPTGVLLDVIRCYHEKPLYDAKKIHCAVLMMRGAWDTSSCAQDMENLFALLGSSTKYYLQIGNATHYALAEQVAAPFMINQCLSFSMGSLF